MLMSGYQTVVQLSALVGFWGAFASHSIFPSTNPLQWRVPIAIQLIPGILLVLGTFLIPETPRFRAEKAQFKSAEASLSWLRGLPTDDVDLQQELSDISEDALASYKLHLKSRSFLTEATKPGVRNRLGVGIGLMIAQNMVGLNALNYYAPVIFMSAGFTSVSSSLFLTGIFGVVKLVSAITFMFVFVRMRGNRFWLKLGSAICGFAMLVLAYYVRILPPPDPSHESSLSVGGVVSVLMVYLFAFFFGVSLGPISWNVCAEIFPLHINAKCCAVTTCTQWLFQIVIAYITPRLLAKIGWATYVIYALFCIASFVWVQFCVPETRGVPVGGPMDDLFGQPEGKRGDDLEGTAEEVEDVCDETTGLLRSEYRMRREHRRSSVIAYT
jgi:sugar porter (SP) family MFS transporter